MSKVVVINHVTLDGVMQGLGLGLGRIISIIDPGNVDPAGGRRLRVYERSAAG